MTLPAQDIVYETVDPQLISLESHDVFGRYYKKWKTYQITVRKDSKIYISSSSQKFTEYFDISICSILKLLTHQDLVAVQIECSKNAITFNFRAILSISEMKRLCASIQQVSAATTIEKFLSSIESEAVVATQENLSLAQLCRKLDKDEVVKKRSATLSKRGAFKFLPVFFSNDLIHASWWFVAGSLLLIIDSIAVVLLSYSANFNDDFLPTLKSVRRSWYLIFISGIFFTLGSLAFVRAMSDPPIKPVFTSYHVSNDTLLGSWLFFWGVVPYIPYSFIFICTERNPIYYGMLILAIVATLVTLLFVFACYPDNDNKLKYEQQPNLVPYLNFLCACCCKSQLDRHCSTDLLMCLWFFFYCTLLAVIVTLLLCIYGFTNKFTYEFIFVDIFGLFDSLLFLIGAAYYVAGSYPVNMVEQDRISSTSSSLWKKTETIDSKGNHEMFGVGIERMGSHL